MISSAIWDESAQVNFSKVNQIVINFGQWVHDNRPNIGTFHDHFAHYEKVNVW